MSRIGILGGTFDPIHLGHLIIASFAAHELCLERVLFMPAQTPPHKRDRTVADASHRVSMIRRAIDPDPRFELSEHDLRTDAPSYTADLLERLRQERPEDDIVFIIGADSLRDFPGWHRPDFILQRAELAVARRPGVVIDDAVLDALPGLRDRTRVFQAPLIEISSTDIRARASRGEPVVWLVPPAVDEYIKHHALYAQP
jgi:nicotinate-nucleotide adenylyltransferase